MAPKIAAPNSIGASTLLLAINRQLTGVISYVDQIRPESLAVLARFATTA